MNTRNSQVFDHVEILSQVFKEKRERNQNYSLRAFARDLAVSAPRLSQVLNGKLGLSSESAKKIAEKLPLSAKEKEQFLISVEAFHSRRPSERKQALLQLKRMKQKDDSHYLSQDQFNVISEWYHMALLELTRLKRFKNDPQWVADTFGIEKGEAERAIQRLIRLNLIEEKSGTLKLVQAKNKVLSEIPSRAIRRYHEQILRKAIAAIDEQTIEERNLSALTLAVSKKEREKIKEEITEFKEQILGKYGGSKEEKDSVYCLSLQLFNLSKNKENL